MLFDGVGGQIANCTALGEGGVSRIDFDSNERWDLRDKSFELDEKHVKFPRHNGPTYYVLPVVLHEIGHIVGLGHSPDPLSVMSPWYNDDLEEVTEAEAEAVKEIYRPK